MSKHSQLSRDFHVINMYNRLKNEGWDFKIEHNRVWLKYPDKICERFHLHHGFFNTGCETMEEAFSYIYGAEEIMFRAGLMTYPAQTGVQS